MKNILLLLISTILLTNIYAQDSIVANKISVGVKSTPPFIIKDSVGNYTGICIDLWENIAKELKVDYEYHDYILADMLDAIKSDKVDICISPLTVTSKRLSEFDFMQPFYVTNLTIAIKRPDQSFSKNFFSFGLIKTFGILIIILIILGFFLWLAERKQYENKVKGPFGIIHFILYLIRLKKSSEPISKEGSLLSVLWGFAIIFIISGYAVTVFFSLNINKLSSDITSVDDLHDYKVGTIKQSAPSAYLDSNNIEKIEYNDMDLLIEGLNTGEIDAIVHDEPIIRFYLYEQKLEQNFQILPVKFNKQYYSFATPRKSEIQYLVNPVLFRQIEINMNSILAKYNLQEE